MGSLKGGKSEFRKDIKSHGRAIKLLFTYSREWSVMGITILMDALYPFISIYLSSMLLQALYEKRPLREMILWILGGAGTTLIVTLIRHITAKYKNTLWWGMRFRTEEPLMEKAMKMDYGLLEDENVQKLRSRQEEYRKHGNGAFNIFIWRGELFLTAFLKLILAAATIGILMAQAESISAKDHPFIKIIGIITVLILSAGFFLIQKLNKWDGLMRHQIWQDEADNERLNTFMMSEIAFDQESGKDIRLFHQEKLLTEYGNQMIANSKELAHNVFKVRIKHDTLHSLWIAALGVIVYLYAGINAYAGSIPVGSIVRFAGGIQQMIQALTDLLDSWNYLHNNRNRMDEFFAYLDLPDNMKQGTIPVQKRKDGRFLIEFQNVSFRYPGTNAYVLKNLNLRFEIGERVALVGPNGSGKTTFVKLLCRLYDPTEGTIFLNDVDIRKYRCEDYMRLFSVVFQDFQVFPFCMGEYIAGGSNVDTSKSLDAVSRTGLSGLLSRLPHGLDTMIGRDFSEEGFIISGGEAQKLAMARAIYKNAPFVILDEPTAALDPLAEHEIYTKFHEVIGDKTALFISHRLSACLFAKEILVFENGNIVQRGSHEGLRGQPGLYQQMWQAQAKYYTGPAMQN